MSAVVHSLSILWHEMVGWYKLLNEHEFEQTLGNGEGQGSLSVLQSVGSQRVGHH